MAIREGILALLGDGPSHGYQLKTDFEDRTGHAWLVNVGQVYTTLGRLERDGLVEPAGDHGDERRSYRLTDHGRAALTEWFATPVVAAAPPRDELATKVLLAIAAPVVASTPVLPRQRTATLEQLQEYTRLKRTADPGPGGPRGEVRRGSAADGGDRELSWVLVLDALILKAEAEVRWLDLCEARLRQRASTDTDPTTSRGDAR